MTTLFLPLIRATYSALTHILRTFGAFVTALLMASLLAFLLSCALIMQFFGAELSTQAGKELRLTILFTQSLTENDLTDLTRIIKGTYPDATLTYTSPDDALAAFLTRLAADSGRTELSDFLREYAGSSLLPATVRIDIPPNQHAHLLSLLAESPFATSILKTAESDALHLATRLASAVHAIQVTTLTSGILITALSVLIVLSLMQLQLAARKSEISIMRLFGATKSFIRAPFVIEGIILTLLASLIGITAGSALLYHLVTTGLSAIPVFGDLIYASADAYFTALPRIYAWVLLSALLIGILGAFAGTYRFLKSEEELF